MLLKLKRTQRNLSSTNREVHSRCTSFSVVKLWINPVPGLLLSLTKPKFCNACALEGVTATFPHTPSLGVLLLRKANFHSLPPISIVFQMFAY